MLQNVNIGDFVVSYPYGVGKVCAKSNVEYCIFVKFSGDNHASFTKKGKILRGHEHPSCWHIEDAPDWVWKYFEKPKILVKRLLEQYVCVDINNKVVRFCSTEEEATLYIIQNEKNLKIVKMHGEYLEEKQY